MPRTLAPSTRGNRPLSARRPFAFVALLLACCAALALSPFSERVANSQTAARDARSLSFSERVAYQRAVDEVYWRHSVWPEENRRPKPPLEEVVTLEQTAEKVSAVLRKSEALARRWGQAVTPEQLQAEVTRMARETKRPEVLRELWQALGNEPYLVAEVLARPALVERLTRTAFDFEQQGSDAKATGEAASFEAWWAGAGGEFTAEAAPAADYDYQLTEINAAGGADDTWKPTSLGQRLFEGRHYRRPLQPRDRQLAAEQHLQRAEQPLRLHAGLDGRGGRRLGRLRGQQRLPQLGRAL